jgi:hypothetical protein
VCRQTRRRRRPQVGRWTDRPPTARGRSGRVPRCRNTGSGRRLPLALDRVPLGAPQAGHGCLSGVVGALLPHGAAPAGGLCQSQQVASPAPARPGRGAGSSGSGWLAGWRLTTEQSSLSRSGSGFCLHGDTSSIGSSGGCGFGAGRKTGDQPVRPPHGDRLLATHAGTCSLAWRYTSQGESGLVHSEHVRWCGRGLRCGAEIAPSSETEHRS